MHNNLTSETKTYNVPQKIKDSKAIVVLLASIFAILFLPLIGLYILNDWTLPSGFFEYPMVTAPSKPGVNYYVASILGLAFIFVFIFYLEPSILGFKKSDLPIEKPIQKAKFPIWGWFGLVLLGIPLFFLWGHFTTPIVLLNWAWVPVFWGYTFLMDAWLYVRTGGKSMVSNSPKEMIAIGVSAMGGWMLFEYLNFFVDDNWFYPNGAQIPDDEFLLYAIIGSSGLIPVVFIIYRLLNTFPKLKNKYKNGPKIEFPNWLLNVLLFGLLLGLFAISFYPNQLFGLLWVAPMCILAIILDKIGIWTPFYPIKFGNWSPLLKYTLTYLIFGISLECINYFSGQHIGDKVITHTPAYWVYSIPYVSFWHVFEMPILGYLGYLPFGIYCSVWWISFAYLLNIPTTYLDDED